MSATHPSLTLAGVASEDKSSPPALSEEAARTWLSTPRFNRYMAAARGSLAMALALYRWNTAVTTAALADVGHLEIALRNAYSAALTERYPDWLSESSPLWAIRVGNQYQRSEQGHANDRTLSDLDDVRRRTTPGATDADVIAATSFGFWASLTDRYREQTLWTKALRTALPTGTARGAVHELAYRSVRLRNRLAHLEPVFTQSTALAQRMHDVWLLHALVHPESADWCHHYSNVADVVAQCPVSGLVQWGERLKTSPSTWLTSTST